MSEDKYPILGAHLSEDQRYRYRLWRQWDLPGIPAKTCLFVMLNPSTADDKVDDPTIRRCVGFAKSWGHGRLEVVNLFAFRTKSPKVLFGVKDDPIGPENMAVIRDAADMADRIICAWGAHGGHLQQDLAIRQLLLNVAGKTFALGFTRDGHPRHPLYAPKSAPLHPMFRQSHRAVA